MATTTDRTPPGPAPTAPASAPPSSRLMWAVLAVVLIADALDLLDSTITTIAAPSIVADIGGGSGLITWLGAAYALSMGALLVVGGRLGDRLGQRRVFLVGMAGFTTASALCGFAVDPAMLLAGRALQGAFGALLIPQGIAIMTKTFDRKMLGRAFAVFGPVLGLATVGGPVLAGFLIDADLAGLGWRPVFLINIVLGSAGLVAAVRVLPRVEADPAVRVDGLGALYLAGGMFALLYGLTEGPRADWNALSLTSLAVGVVGFGLFCRRQLTAASPLIRPTLLANRGFTSALLMGLAYFAALNGLVYVISLFLQEGLGLRPSAAALHLLPMTAGIIVAAGACMALLPRLGRSLVPIGLLLTAGGGAWLLAAIHSSGTEVGGWMLVLPVFVVGLGMGACFGTIYDLALGDIDPAEAGSASGSLSAVQQLAAGIGSAVVTSVYLSTTASGGLVHAMTISLVIVTVVTVACVGLVPLLPRRAPAENPELAH
jgi:EmrB/QacA subfamily drug resistance transporter